MNGPQTYVIRGVEDTLMGHAERLIEFAMDADPSPAAMAEVALHIMRNLWEVYPKYQQLPGVDLPSLELEASAVMRRMRRARGSNIARIYGVSSEWAAQAEGQEN